MLSKKVCNFSFDVTTKFFFSLALKINFFYGLKSRSGGYLLQNSMIVVFYKLARRKMVFSQVPMENLVHMEEFALPSCIRVLFILSNVNHQ